MINIDIMDSISKANWSTQGNCIVKSGHCYRYSPFETCDSCGNCDGGNCDSCEDITIPAHIVFSISTDKLYHILLDKGVPEEDASEIAYSDFCKSNTSGNYHLVWPTEHMIKESNPEMYKEITELSIEIETMLDECFNDSNSWTEFDNNFILKLGKGKYYLYNEGGWEYNQMRLYIDKHLKKLQEKFNK